MPRLLSHRSKLGAFFILVALVVVGSVSVSFTRAQTPRENASQTAAEELMKSVTAEQRQAISAVVAGYQDKLQTSAKELAKAQSDAVSGSYRLLLPLVIAEGRARSVVAGTQQVHAPQEQTVDPKTTAAIAALDSTNTSLQATFAALEADLAHILTPEQMTLYRTAMTTMATSATGDAGQTASSQTSDTGVADVIDPVLCFNAAQWADYGLAYSKVAKSYALINAFDLTFGTNTGLALDSYISYNEAESYALDGLQNLSTAAVLFTASDNLVLNVNGGTLFGVKGDNDIDIAEARNDLARTRALNDYLASGGVIIDGVPFGGRTFAYLSYAYGNIADIFLDGTKARTSFCF